MDEGDARSLAGVFVDMVRQQHEQRGLLVRCGAQQLWKECTQLTDCCRCKRLSYITVALDNSVSSVSPAFCLESAARPDCPGGLLLTSTAYVDCHHYSCCAKQILPPSPVFVAADAAALKGLFGHAGGQLHACGEMR